MTVTIPEDLALRLVDRLSSSRRDLLERQKKAAELGLVEGWRAFSALIRRLDADLDELAKCVTVSRAGEVPMPGVALPIVR